MNGPVFDAAAPSRLRNIAAAGDNRAALQGLPMPGPGREMSESYSMSTGCASMRVCYLGQVEAERASARDRIQILLPDSETSLDLSYSSSEGNRRVLSLQGPRITVIPANRSYAIENSCRTGLIVIALDPAFYEDRARDAFTAGAPTLAARFNAVDPLLQEVGNTLRSQCRLSKLPSRQYCESLAGVIAIHLALHYASAGEENSSLAGLSPAKLDRVLAFIKEHLAQSIRVEHLAEAAHLSPCHFARMFKQATGQSPHAYITAQRMEHARQLLANSSLSLVDVASSAGFQTQAHFTEVFHRHTGVTPRSFRRSCRSQAEDASLPGSSCSKFSQTIVKSGKEAAQFRI